MQPGSGYATLLLTPGKQVVRLIACLFPFDSDSSSANRVSTAEVVSIQSVEAVVAHGQQQLFFPRSIEPSSRDHIVSDQLLGLNYTVQT